MTTFRLKIWQVAETCLFELTWGAGLQRSAQVPYPEKLAQQFQSWQTAYLQFYRSALRARSKGSGGLAAPDVDRRSQLVQAEAQFLSAFVYWLGSADLLGIRSEIAKAAMGGERVDLFLACEPLALARLPWEAWEIGTEFGNTKPIRIARTPANLSAEVQPARKNGRLRILAVLGDDTGLNFQADRAAMESLGTVATIEFVGWQAGQEAGGLQETIAAAIDHPLGWDILFFAGHSNETDLTGGELGIAPGISIAIKEIAPQLKRAQERGLQFALFNSCNGLEIANSLIDLGLSQVAIFREPVHNRVAQEFLLRFVQELVNYGDVHEATIAAAQFLKVDRNLTYPSAYLIPSLFRHPEAPVFCLKPQGLRQDLRRWMGPWLPDRKQAWGLVGLLALSILPPIQGLFLEPRLLLQAMYRDRTHQIPKVAALTTLIQIDEDSLRGLDARKINPIDRTYLAQVITSSAKLQPKTLAIDFLLDRPTEEDPILAKAIQGLTRQNIRPVFAASRKESGKILEVTPTVASRADQGYIEFYPGYLELPARNCSIGCPFAWQTIQARSPYLNPVAQWAEGWGQFWFRPVFDFSIPPERAYTKVSAKAVLDGTPLPVSDVVMIAAGGYEQAGISRNGEDNLQRPLAINYWDPGKGFTGAEYHAYGLYHLEHGTYVYLVPAVLLMGLGAMGGAVLRQRNLGGRSRVLGYGGAIVGYGLLSLQVYISAGLLLPWLLPSLVFGLYGLPKEKV